MSIRIIRTNCGRCRKHFAFPLNEIVLHIDNDVLLCPSCCKESFWHDEERCSKCSDKPICSGVYKKIMIEKISKIEGL